ncbi:hypothetical protein [Roseiterribacter gracilis]|uniref:Uncharacterized protein n=1 Tax=Roseiterribacter gracilis TaxID=2812848 RepID=A0A8S8XCK0_9PROT|nr:hypothetical protein TMPK1_16260 [Rhodospirillales bacterium TMPK1]
MARILLKTTIPATDDDWAIHRFAMLADALRRAGHEVTAADRVGTEGDRDIAQLDKFDQLWLFAVDVGGGITRADVDAIDAFRKRGGGVMVTRDHMDLGACLTMLPELGAAHHFHSKNQEPDPARQHRDDPFTTYIDFPNYHSGANGDFQRITPVGDLHPLLRRADGAPLEFFPSHPHEGAVSAPASVPHARVIACGSSKVTGTRFNLAVVFEGDTTRPGRAVAQSTFHHFSDLNWDPRAGAPSFVTEAPGSGMLDQPQARDDARRYALNLAAWLSQPRS